MRACGRYDLGMYTPTAILSSILTLAPPPDTPPAFDVSDVEVEYGEQSTQVTAFDADGEVTAEVIVWAVDGEPRVDAVWPDGLYLSIADGSFESDDLGEASERMVVLETAMAGATEEESNDCLFALLGLGAAVGSKNPLLIAGGLYAVHKWCVRTLQDGEDEECDCETSEETGS